MKKVMSRPRYNRGKQGFIAFSSLLIISAVTLAIAVSVSILGISEANTALGGKKGQEAQGIAQGCVEEALLQLRNSASYGGSSLTMGGGSCTIIISGSGANRTIDVSATIAGAPVFIKRLQVTVKRTGNSINILTWNEI